MKQTVHRVHVRIVVFAGCQERLQYNDGRHDNRYISARRRFAVTSLRKICTYCTYWLISVIVIIRDLLLRCLLLWNRVKHYVEIPLNFFTDGTSVASSHAPHLLSRRHYYYRNRAHFNSMIHLIVIYFNISFTVFIYCYNAICHCFNHGLYGSTSCYISHWP